MALVVDVHTKAFWQDVGRFQASLSRLNVDAHLISVLDDLRKHTDLDVDDSDLDKNPHVKDCWTQMKAALSECREAWIDATEIERMSNDIPHFSSQLNIRVPPAFILVNLDES